MLFVWGVISRIKYEKNAPSDLRVFCDWSLEEDEARRYVPSRRADRSKVDALKSCGKRNERDSDERLKKAESHLEECRFDIFVRGPLGKFSLYGLGNRTRGPNKLEVSANTGGCDYLYSL